MSTKSTLAHGNKPFNFHFYSEAFDYDAVHLEMRTGDDRNYHFQTITIPLVVWEVIRTRTIMERDLIGKTDAQLRKYAEKYVRGRIRDFEQSVRKRMRKGDSREEAERGCGILKLMGAFSFASMDDPVRTQISKGLKSLKTQRASQERLQKQIDRLLKENEGCPGIFVRKLKRESRCHRKG